MLLTLALALACAGAGPLPVAPPPPGAPPPRVPVVLVPGLTGTELVDGDGGVVWGSGWRALFPRDRGHALALPLDDAAPRRLRPGRVLREVTLLGGVVREPVYGPLIRAFETRGYVAGSLADPRPGDTFLTFPYDWRRGNVHTAGELLAALQRLRRARGHEVLAVDLICQSSAAHVCRWLVKHGGAGLAAAEAGGGGLPPEVRVRRVVLVGASNAGSLRTLYNLHRGRTYLRVGRHFAPETLFTFRSLYQDLPARSAGHFLDATGRRLDVDLHDPASWARYGWSVFAPDVAERLAADPRPDLFGAAGERRDFLARQLARAQRFHRALARDVDLGGARYLLLQNGSTPTMTRAVLAPAAGGGWVTLFPYQRWFRRRPHLYALATAPGDLHATLESQRALSPGELTSLAAEPLTVPGGHFRMILHPAALRWMVAALAPPVERPPVRERGRPSLHLEPPHGRT